MNGERLRWLLTHATKEELELPIMMDVAGAFRELGSVRVDKTSGYIVFRARFDSTPPAEDA